MLFKLGHEKTKYHIYTQCSFSLFCLNDIAFTTAQVKVSDFEQQDLIPQVFKIIAAACTIALITYSTFGLHLQLPSCMLDGLNLRSRGNVSHFSTISVYLCICLKYNRRAKLQGKYYLRAALRYSTRQSKCIIFHLRVSQSFRNDCKSMKGPHTYNKPNQNIILFSCD